MKIGIIGYGIVGAILGYHLSKVQKHEVHVYDVDTYQGTKNAVGIICPWVSQRRNKQWYGFAKEGVVALHSLAKELNDASFMTRNGVLILHEKLNRFYDIAHTHYDETPIIGMPQILSNDVLKTRFPPTITLPKQGLFIPGGFQVDGERLLDILKENSRLTFHHEWATLKGDRCINGTDYDCVCVCAGGFSSQVLPTISLDSMLQKGIMFHLNETYQTLPHQPPIMPQGEIDILSRHGRIAIGASHQNTFDSFEVEPDVIHQLLMQARRIIPTIKMEDIASYAVGTRSVSHDNTPYITAISERLFVIAGLGSSGLTTGPYLAIQLAHYILGINSDPSIFDLSRFHKKT